MEADRPVKRALISVYDKTGIVPFAEFLQKAGVEIVSTGGTASALKDAGLKVTELSDYTGYPEMLSGRVKTLHPKIHGGLLYVRGNAEHEATVKKHGIGSIDIVVVNLYPFDKVAATPGATKEEILENIDIGGPSLIRSAAKNYDSVVVIVDPADYDLIIDEIKTQGGITSDRRRELAGKAYAKTAVYDSAIASYFGETNQSQDMTCFCAPLVQQLRYGENPHQKAALYGSWELFYKQLQGKALSYNNVLDITAVMDLMGEFDGEDPTIAIFKHGNPCGVGQAKTLVEAWTKALATDSQSAFGGVIATNTEVDAATAHAIKDIFSEIVVAPSFSAEALEILSAKKDLRLMRLLNNPQGATKWRMRSVGADSFVMQENDTRSVMENDLRIVTKRQPTSQEKKAMLFAWKVAKHVKSNAVVFASGDRTLGVGAGQMSRVDSSKIAIHKAGEAGLNLGGSVVASDAFFPFADGVIAAANTGVTAVIQPGGSIKDEEVIRVADELGLAMAFTGVRHFKH